MMRVVRLVDVYAAIHYSDLILYCPHYLSSVYDSVYPFPPRSLSASLPLLNICKVTAVPIMFICDIN